MTIIQILIPICSGIIAQNVRWGIPHFTTKCQEFGQEIKDYGPFPGGWYGKIYISQKIFQFPIHRHPLLIGAVSLSGVRVHNVMLGISIPQKNLLFTFTNLSISGINTHWKVIYFGMVRKGLSRAFQMCTIQISIPLSPLMIQTSFQRGTHIQL